MSNYTKRKQKRKEHKRRMARLYPARFSRMAFTSTTPTNRAHAAAYLRHAQWLCNQRLFEAARDAIAAARDFRHAATETFLPA